MKYKIFYNKDTLKIMGMSDDKKTMDHPYVETSEKYHSLNALEIVEDKGKYIVQPMDPQPPLIPNYNKMRLYKK